MPMYKAFAKSPLCLFLACVVASIAGCWSCLFISDCGNPDDRLPVYANKSGETVKIVSIVRDYRDFYYEKFIANGDTLHYETESMEDEWFVPYIGDCGLIVSWNCNEPIPIRMELHFLGEPEKCLIFDGPIKNDGFDMRSLSSYKRGKKIDDWADFWDGVEYVYTITPEHKAKAREEDCLSAERE